MPPWGKHETKETNFGLAALKLCGVVKTKSLIKKKKNLVKVDWIIDLEQISWVARGGAYDTRYKKYSLDKTLLPFLLFSYYRTKKNP